MDDTKSGAQGEVRSTPGRQIRLTSYATCAG